MMKAEPKQTNNANHPGTLAAESSRENQSAQPSLISGRMAAQRASIAELNDSPRMLAQRRRIEGYLGIAAQQQPIQRLEKPDDEKEETLQPKFASEPPAQLERQNTPKPNNTGLPDNLKNGIESLSGMSMDNVKVHYNSSQPAQLNALAYAQGTDIHVAPGQEQHLPHEAWHLVQQAQGRVQPTMQMKDGVPVNDDKGLEREADTMGAMANQQDSRIGQAKADKSTTATMQSTTQFTVSQQINQGYQLSEATIQRRTTVAAAQQTPHALIGDAQMSDQQPVPIAGNGDRPIIIEVMEGNRDSAIAKINSIAATANATDNRAIIIGLNQPAIDGDIAANNRLNPGRNFAAYGALLANVIAVADHAEANHVQGGCFPVIWSPSAQNQGGYTFPFLEMRAHVTLHPGTTWLIDRLRDATNISPVMRSMDADVSADPLLNTPLSGMSINIKKAINDLGRVPYEEREVQGAVGPENTADDMSEKGADIVSGGYRWDTSPKDGAFWQDGFAQHGAGWNLKLRNCLEFINDGEHDVRLRYNQLLSKAVYWPEPNSYMDSQARRTGAEAAMEAGVAAGAGAQQRESSYYIRDIADLKGRYNSELQTTKPLKTYFVGLRDLIKRADNERLSSADVAAVVRNIRQTHLSSEHLDHIANWNQAGVISDDISSMLESFRANIFNRVVLAILGNLR